VEAIHAFVKGAGKAGYSLIKQAYLITG